MSATTLPDGLSPAARRFLETPTHGLLIDGEAVPAADGRTFASLDPATGREIAAVAQAGADDVDRAVAAARRALGARAWAGITAGRRGELIEALARAVGEHADELAELEALDN